jgi:hypothetical protein
MARLSTTDADTMLNASVVAATTYYLALFTTDPGTTGASGEVTGGSYARQAITFGTASAGSVASTNSQLFSSLPVEAGGIGYFAIFTASSGGSYKWGGTTTGLSGSLPAGINVSFAVGGVTAAQS